jgi:hypothetical protein
VAELLEASSESVENPQIALDSSGNAIATWHQDDGLRTNIWANRYDAETGWGTAELIESNDAGFAYDPQIAFNTVGNAIVVWAHDDGSVYRIWARPYLTGTGWGTAEIIVTDDNSGHHASNPQIAFDGNGNAIAVWQQYDLTVMSIWANRYEPGSGWGTAELLEADDASGHDAYNPQIALDANGNAIAGCQQYDGTVTNIWANRYVPGSGWGTAELIETDNVTQHHAIYPQIAVDGNGNAIAVWEQSDGSTYSAWGNRYVAGTGWGTAELLESDNLAGHNARSTAIATDGDGNMIAVWKQSDGTRFNIWANRFE